MTSRRAERGEPAGGQSRGVEDAQHAALAAPLGAAADLRDAHDQAHEDRLGPAGEQLRVDVVAHLPTCLRGAHRVGDVACEPAERGQACEPGQRIGFVATDDPARQGMAFQRGEEAHDEHRDELRDRHAGCPCLGLVGAR